MSDSLRPMDYILPDSAVQWDSRQEYWSGLPCPLPVDLIPWEKHNSKRHLYPNVHCSTIYNTRTWKQPICPLMMDKEVAVHTYSGILLSHQDELMCQLNWAWSNLWPVIQSEASQKEKNKYILMHMYGIQKNSTGERMCRAGMEMHMYRTDTQKSTENSRNQHNIMKELSSN